MRAGCILLTIALIACGGCAVNSSVKQMTFVRSGGFGGAMMRVDGAVDFSDRGASVTSKSRNYHRDVDSSEAAKIRAAADPESWGSIPPEAKEAGSRRDAFKYDVTVITTNGQSHSLTLYDSPSTPLGEWLKQETQRIFTSN